VTGLLGCAVCGDGFYGRSDAVYCSPACRQKAHRARVALRLAALEGQQRPVASARSAFEKPDVAAIIERAREQQRRAHELCRIAEETLQECLKSQRQLMAVRWLTRTGTAAPAEAEHVSDMIARESG
jgi:hypothetical protein